MTFPGDLHLYYRWILFCLFLRALFNQTLSPAELLLLLNQLIEWRFTSSNVGVVEFVGVFVRRLKVRNNSDLVDFKGTARLAWMFTRGLHLGLVGAVWHEPFSRK